MSDHPNSSGGDQGNKPKPRKRERPSKYPTTTTPTDGYAARHGVNCSNDQPSHSSGASSFERNDISATLYGSINLVKCKRSDCEEMVPDYELRDHNYKHGTDISGRFSCADKDCRFWGDLVDLVTHYLSTHKGSIFDVKTRKMDQRQALTCKKECGHLFYYKDEYHAHLRLPPHSLNPCKNSCGKYLKENQLRIHFDECTEAIRQKAKKPKTKKLECCYPNCLDKQFDGENAAADLSDHEKRKHSADARVVCNNVESCGRKSKEYFFDNTNVLMLHQRHYHLTIKAEECGACVLILSSEERRVDHEARHFSAQYPFTCRKEGCGQVMRNPPSRIAHEKDQHREQKKDRSQTEGLFVQAMRQTNSYEGGVPHLT